MAPRLEPCLPPLSTVFAPVKPSAAAPGSVSYLSTRWAKGASCPSLAREDTAPGASWLLFREAAAVSGAGRSLGLGHQTAQQIRPPGRPQPYLGPLPVCAARPSRRVAWGVWERRQRQELPGRLRGGRRTLLEMPLLTLQPRHPNLVSFLAFCSFFSCFEKISMTPVDIQKSMKRTDAHHLAPIRQKPAQLTELLPLFTGDFASEGSKSLTTACGDLAAPESGNSLHAFKFHLKASFV